MNRATDTHLDEASFLRLERRDGETLRAALERELRDAIREGSLREGVKLPSSRALAAHLGVSRGVTSDAYAQLEAQGFIVQRSRAAPTVASVAAASRPTAKPEAAEAPAARYDMASTAPDVTLFPMRQWLNALTRAASDAPLRALDYGDPRGEPSLREVLADHLGRTRGLVVDPDAILIVQGFAQGFAILMRILADRGARTIAVEDPSQRRQRAQIAAAGLAYAGWPVDECGVTVPGGDADAIVVTPAHQFPTGAVMSGERRRALLSWAERGGGLVIEDDYDSEFRYDREPVRAIQGLGPDRVAYLGTTSKSLAPALRLGWLVVPPELVEDASRAKLLADVFSPVLGQLALRRLIETGEYDRHVRRAKAVYRSRRDRLIAALAEHLPDLPVAGIAAGLHVVAVLPDQVDDVSVEQAAREAGVSLEALSPYFLGPAHASGLLLGYGRLHEDAIATAVAELAPVLRDATGGSRFP